jgi:uncharacterized protein
VGSFFFDSSALVKRYVTEIGSVWVQHLTDPNIGHSIYISGITGVEIVSAIARRVKGLSISPADGANAIADFKYDYANQYNILEVTDHIVNQAMDLAQAYALRAYDALQLSTALELNTTVLAELAALGITPRPDIMPRLISSDNDLNSAAVAKSLLMDDPLNHP